MKLLLTRRYQFRGLHQINEKLESRPEGVLHGHDFGLEVTVAGSVDSKAGWITSRDQLDEIVQNKIIDPFDKSLLNHHFRHATGEALVAEFFKILKRELNGLYKVALQETRKNRFYVLAQ